MLPEKSVTYVPGAYPPLAVPHAALVQPACCSTLGWCKDGAAAQRCSSGGLKRRRLRAVPLAVVLDVGTKRWQALILT